MVLPIALIYVADFGCTGRVSTGRFRTLSTGNPGQPGSWAQANGETREPITTVRYQARTWCLPRCAEGRCIDASSFSGPDSACARTGLFSPFRGHGVPTA